MRSLLSAALFLALAGCGYVGPPQPPALNIPKPIADFRVSEVGDRIVVHFTPPDQTTEKLPITSLQSIDLYAGLGEANFVRDRWLSTARRYQVTSPQTGDYSFDIPASDWVGQQLILAIRTTGKSGRQSDLSNYGYLDVGAPLTTPTVPVLTSTADGVHLEWTGNAPRYRILRSTLSTPDSKLERLAEVDAPNYVDQTATLGARYQYVILGLKGDVQQSLPSPAAAIEPIDTFAPDVPSGLTALAGANSIDLSWSRNTEDDLAGYNVFRATEDGPFELVSANLGLPAYNDAKVETGKRYRYTVSAIDMTGNESARSAETSARIE